VLIGAIGDCARNVVKLLRADGTRPDDPDRWLGDATAAICIRPWGAACLDSLPRYATDDASGSWLALSGRPYAPQEGERGIALVSSSNRLLAALLSQGAGAIKEFSGSFAIAWFDGRNRQLYLIRDRFGMEPLFYAPVGGGVLFGSRVRDLAATGLLPGGLSPQGLAEYLTYCFVPGDDTLDREVRRVPAGSWIRIDPRRGVAETRRWYRIPYGLGVETDEAQIAGCFRSLLESAVSRHLGGGRVGAFLSGGMDSSSIVTLARRHVSGSLHTFSYRCAGKSFDESDYARALSTAMQTTHTELKFDEACAFEIERAVEEMDVPFSDTGLEIGTWLLGRAAGKHVDYVLTGDGGDEFWGSHPVYAAQRLLGWYERLPLPGWVRRALPRIADRLSDSDQKRDLRVKLKRIFPPLGMPRELGPFRWRTYNLPEQLEALLVPEMAREVRERDPFRCILQGFEGYDGPDDGLSPYLYNDYTIISSVYFNRLRLTRRFGVEVRCPFYDPPLVEFGACIPARLKLEGLETTKRLFRVAMEGVLPDIINHRKDKLGHSIPFKNWLRGNGPLSTWMMDLCRPETIRRRGLFQPAAITRLLDEHRQRRQNHAHRLWAVCVLELWLRTREKTSLA